MKYRVLKSAAVYKVQRKVFRVWVTISTSRDLPLAIAMCARMSVGGGGAAESVAAVFRVEANRGWLRWGDALVGLERTFTDAVGPREQRC